MGNSMCISQKNSRKSKFLSKTRGQKVNADNIPQYPLNAKKMQLKVTKPKQLTRCSSDSELNRKIQIRVENNDSLNELYEQFTPNLTHKRVHEIKKVFYKLGDVDGVSKSSHDLYVKN